MRIRYWSSDVCSSDLGKMPGNGDIGRRGAERRVDQQKGGNLQQPDQNAGSIRRPGLVGECEHEHLPRPDQIMAAGVFYTVFLCLMLIQIKPMVRRPAPGPCCHGTRRSPARSGRRRSEEHTSELQSLMRISYAVFCLKQKKHEPTIKPMKAHIKTQTTHETQ